MIPQNNSHYEYVINSSINERAKLQAIDAMKHLEGWCSVEKASILIDLILIKKPHIVVEVGVFGGKSLVPIALALKANIEGVVFGIDPWSNSECIKGMEGEHYTWWSKIDLEAIYQGLRTQIATLELENQIHIMRTTSQDAPAIRDIEFLHLDGNHSEEGSCFDVQKWVPLVIEGGIIIFDDINWESTQKAVGWLDENCTRLIQFVDENNSWGIWIKR